MVELDAVTAEQQVDLLLAGRIDCLRAHCMRRNTASAFALSCAPSSSRLTPRSSATRVAVSSRYAGRLGTPMRLCALPYGESVSRRSRSAGHCLTTSLNAFRLGRVTSPAKER